MSTRTPKRLILLGIAALTAGVIPAVAPAASAPVPIPTDIPGVAALPGPIAAPSTEAPNLGLLKVTPDQAAPASRSTISGTGLPVDRDVSIQWGTAVATWMLDARADSIDYLGRKTDKVNVVLATGTRARPALSASRRASRPTGAASTTSTP
jgi:hypothetical protein